MTGAPLTWRVGLAERPIHHQDRSLIDRELGLFGVFDGVGSISRAGEAAQVAAETVARCCHAGERNPGAALVRGCEQAEVLIKQQRLGATTATVVWVKDRELWYVSVGDSRLYRQAAGSNSLVQVTTDEGVGNLLDNALGEGPDRKGAEVAPQRSSLALGSGDKLLLVTDGITGDSPPDLLTARELTVAISGGEPQLGAERLLGIARKHDDRTALVIFLE
ncbi:MAG: PP2C family protein-serine/threonine phosphatase [Candidatus Dormibacteria bacterium]